MCVTKMLFIALSETQSSFELFRRKASVKLCGNYLVIHLNALTVNVWNRKITTKCYMFRAALSKREKCAQLSALYLTVRHPWFEASAK